jgi:hypothetical protein
MLWRRLPASDRPDEHGGLDGWRELLSPTNGTGTGQVASPEYEPDQYRTDAPEYQ